MRSSHLRWGLTLTELLVVLGIIAVLLALLFPAVQRIRDAAHRTACAANLRQVGLGLHRYHGDFQHLPPGVSYRNGADPHPFMSWQTRLLPYLEQQAQWDQALRAFAQQRDFRRNPPHTGLAIPMPIYGCPADNRTLTAAELPGGFRVAFTSYLGVSGSNPFRRDGVLYLDSRVRLADVRDGLSNTLFVGERPPSANGVYGWWYAGQGQLSDGSADVVLRARERNFDAVYAAGCPAGPYTFGPGSIQNQCDTFHFWSLHFGGAHFLFGDGSVRFLRYSAAPVVPALATRNGGEAVVPPD
jgi:type II secretory pathway pseudopilin PulG